jgi:hypothetical protein
MPDTLWGGVSVSTSYGVVCVGGCVGPFGGVKLSAHAFFNDMDRGAEQGGFLGAPGFPVSVKMAAVAARDDRVGTSSAGGGRGRR